MTTDSSDPTTGHPLPIQPSPPSTNSNATPMATTGAQSEEMPSMLYRHRVQQHQQLHEHRINALQDQMDWINQCFSQYKRSNYSDHNQFHD